MALVPTGNGAQMTHDHKLQVQVGGRAAATTWPMQPGQALDVFFDGKDGAYQPGYYRGIVDVAGAPSKTGIQKLDIDFPDDRTSAAIDLKRSQLYAPGTEPANRGCRRCGGSRSRRRSMPCGGALGSLAQNWQRSVAPRRKSCFRASNLLSSVPQML